MDAQWRTSLWQQFGAAIDMLAQGLHVCPAVGGCQQRLGSMQARRITGEEAARELKQLL